jgi:hypothetical protein
MLVAYTNLNTTDQRVKEYTIIYYIYHAHPYFSVGNVPTFMHLMSIYLGYDFICD